MSVGYQIGEHIEILKGPLRYRHAKICRVDRHKRIAEIEVELFGRYTKAKVALEELDDGQILSVKMNDGEPVQNVPRSIKEEGHQILKLTANEDGTYTLIVRKVEDED